MNGMKFELVAAQTTKGKLCVRIAGSDLVCGAQSYFLLSNCTFSAHRIIVRLN